jgi:NAD(P)-dependent dehydrogenase (short-subunit alcohol dehydrogenase family)
MKITDSTVLVTGANRGIGKALLEEVLRRGAKRVYAATRQPFEQESWEDSPAGWPKRPKGTHAYRNDGRPIVQWPRVEAGYSDDLGTDGW